MRYDRLHNHGDAVGLNKEDFRLAALEWGLSTLVYELVGLQSTATVDV